MPSSAVLLGILTNLCTLFWSVGALYFLCLAVGSSMVPISCTQCVTLSFNAFRSILVSDVNLQLCFPGRPQPIFVRYFNNGIQLTLQATWLTMVSSHKRIGTSANVHIFVVLLSYDNHDSRITIVKCSLLASDYSYDSDNTAN